MRCGPKGGTVRELENKVDIPHARYPWLEKCVHRIAYLYIYIHTRTHLCIYIYVHTYIYMYIYIHTFQFIFIYIHVHTYRWVSSSGRRGALCANSKKSRFAASKWSLTPNFLGILGSPVLLSWCLRVCMWCPCLVCVTWRIRMCDVTQQFWGFLGSPVLFELMRLCV